MDRWVGKVALVTGASVGIGAAIAEELARAGLKVIGLARRAEKIEELKKKIGQVKGELVALKGDVSKEEDILEAFRWIKEHYGTIHVLVNNAGIARIGTLTGGKISDFRDIFDVNVLGLSLCTQEAYKLMRDTKVDDGHIIHINSGLGHRIPVLPIAMFNVYPATKFAVTALTETLRQELNVLKSKIRVTSISPGIVRTDFGANDGWEIPEEIKKIHQSSPALKPKDLAESVVYVLSTPAHVQVHELTLTSVE